MAQGYPWALVGGTTSEWPSLTTDERLALMDAWSAASRKHGLKLLMHVGHSQVGEARKLAAHAEALKVEAVLVAPPMLPFRAPTLDLLVETLGHILAAAPTRPAVYYHYPQLYGDTFAAKDMLESGLPTLVGIKCAGEISHTELMEAATAPGDFAVITTADKTVDAVAMGARGIIAYSFEGKLLAPLLTASLGGDVKGARAAMIKLQAERAVIGAFNAASDPPGMGNYQVTAAKGVAQISGLDVGGSRLPLPSLTAEEVVALRAALDKAGFLPPPVVA